MPRRGRKPGYKHSDETKAKMREFHTGQRKDEVTKNKISKSLSGKKKSIAHREALSDSLCDIDRKCMNRFLEMRAEYPGFEDFFDSNKSKLLFALRDIKSESELRDIRRYIETTQIDEVPQACLKYQYDSSSIYAQEEAMVDLIDAARFLRNAYSTKEKNALLH